MIWSVLFVLFVFGVAARVSMRGEKKGILVTVICLLVAGGMWAIAYTVPTHGSEGNGVMALMLSCLAAGAVAAEVWLLLRRVVEQGKERRAL